MKERAYEVLQLPPCLLDDTVLTIEDDTHSAEVTDFRSADNQGVNVETSSSKDSRYTGEDTRFILDQAVEYMLFKGLETGRRRIVEDISYGFLSTP
jgi:hypothetical protein